MCALHGAKCVVSLSAVIVALSRTDIRGLAADATATPALSGVAFPHHFPPN